MIVHSVYFSLHKNGAAEKKQFVNICKKYLTDHPGSLYFACGERAPEFVRDVNDKDHDVALLIVFEDKASHDRYAVSPRHVQFIDENKHLWRQVRVFDASAES